MRVKGRIGAAEAQDGGRVTNSVEKAAWIARARPLRVARKAGISQDFSARLIRIASGVFSKHS